MNCTANLTFSNITLCNSSSNVLAGSPRRPNRNLEPELWLRTIYVAGIYLSIIAPLTVLANSLMIYAILKTQSKTPKTPATGFLVGVALVDIITALLCEPCLAFCFIGINVKGIKQREPREICMRTIFDLVQVAVSITANISFLTVLMFTFVQYLALVSPIKIASQVTRKKVILCQVIIWLYSILFQVPYLSGAVKQTVLIEIDMYLHVITVTVLSIVLYALLYRIFRRRMAHSTRLRSENRHDINNVRSRRLETERKFIVINFFLICIMLVTNLPNIGFWFAKLYLNLPQTLDTIAINTIIECILYLKFFLNSFVYAWRFSKYRLALWELLCCERRSRRSNLERATEMTLVSLGTTTTTPAVSLISISPLVTT